jgi:hypothetical protein
MKLDLHVHSTFSDGVHSPTELVAMAKARGVRVLGLADHDCVDGVPEALRAGQEHGVEVVAGVELSCEFEGRDLHVLGYGFDPADAALADMLQRFRDTRHRRGLRIVENLRRLGVPITPEEVLEKSPDGSLGRPHIAQVLVDRGIVADHAEAFEKYLGEHCPAYVKKYKLSPAEAIDHIRRAGGVAVLAHPGEFLDDGAMGRLLGYGFDGLEILHPQHDSRQVERLRRIAEERGMVVTGGTDFHGFPGRDVPIGEFDFPDEAWETLRRRLRS